MWFKRILLSLGIFAITTANAQDNRTVSPPENVISENVTNPSNPSESVTDTMTANLLPIYSMQCNISKQNAADLVRYEIIRSPSNSTIEPQEVIHLLQSKNLIIAQKLIDVNYESILYVTNTKIIDFLRNLTTYVPLRRFDNLRKISAAFGIDFDKYIEIFTEEDNIAMWDLLKAGNYTENSIQSVLTILQHSEGSVLSVIGSFVFNKLQNLSLESVLNKFSDEFDELFDESNITLDEIVRYPTLNKAFHNVSQELINSTGIEGYWATAVSNNTLVTATNFTSNPAIDIYVTNIQNMAVYKTSQPILNNMFSILTVQNPLESFINISDKSLKNPDCWFFMKINGTLAVDKPENPTFEDSVIVIQNNGFVHKLGSPLICNNLLYGLLIRQNDTKLVFAATFPKCESEKPTALDNSATRNMHIYFVLAIAIMISCTAFIL